MNTNKKEINFDSIEFKPIERVSYNCPYCGLTYYDIEQCKQCIKVDIKNGKTLHPAIYLKKLYRDGQLSTDVRIVKSDDILSIEIDINISDGGVIRTFPIRAQVDNTAISNMCDYIRLHSYIVEKDEDSNTPLFIKQP